MATRYTSSRPVRLLLGVAVGLSTLLLVGGAVALLAGSRPSTALPVAVPVGLGAGILAGALVGDRLRRETPAGQRRLALAWAGFGACQVTAFAAGLVAGSVVPVALGVSVAVGAVAAAVVFEYGGDR